MSKIIEIEYCHRCHWLARACWYTQEVLQTFSEDISSVRLTPSNMPGVFTIKLNETLVMDRKVDGFRDAVWVKRALKQELGITRKLGHIDP